MESSGPGCLPCVLSKIPHRVPGRTQLRGMSKENFEIVWRGIQAFNGRDLTSAFSVWSSDAEIDWSRSKGPLKGVYRGQAELERFWAELWSTFGTIEVKTHGFIRAGADVVIPNSAHLRGREGLEVIVRSTFVYRVERGQITRLRMFQKLADALDAAGFPSSQNYRCGRKAAVWRAAKKTRTRGSRLCFRTRGDATGPGPGGEAWRGRAG
jgi:ketosteroid isomerase-like protein